MCGCERERERREEDKRGGGVEMDGDRLMFKQQVKDHTWYYCTGWEQGHLLARGISTDQWWLRGV